MKFFCANPKLCDDCVTRISYPQKFARFALIQKCQIELQANTHVVFALLATFAWVHDKKSNFGGPQLLKGGV